MGRRHAWAICAGIVGGCAASPPAFPDAAEGTGAQQATTSTTSEASGSTLGDADASGTSDASTDTGSGPDTTHDASGPGPAVCGDGTMQDGEACDDANASQIDGCTSGCEVGPIGLQAGEVQASPLLLYGNAGPIVMDADCPTDAAIVGIDIGWPKGVGGITVRCASLSLLDDDPTAARVGPDVALPPVGAYPGEDYALLCPPDEVLGELTSAGYDGGAIFGFGGTCRRLDVLGRGSAQSITIDTGATLPFQGFEEAEDVTSCPPQTVATGMTVHMQSSEWPVGVALRCRSLALSYP